MVNQVPVDIWFHNELFYATTGVKGRRIVAIARDLSQVVKAAKNQDRIARSARWRLAPHDNLVVTGPMLRSLIEEVGSTDVLALPGVRFALFLDSLTVTGLETMWREDRNDFRSPPWSRGHRRLWLADMDLRGCDFAGSDIRGCVFGTSQLNSANFSGTLLNQAELREAILIGSHFEETQLDAVDADYCQLTGAHLYRASAKDASFQNSDWRGVSARHASFTGSDFYEAIMIRADFSRSNLDSCEMWNVEAPQKLSPSPLWLGLDRQNMWSIHYWYTRSILASPAFALNKRITS